MLVQPLGQPAIGKRRPAGEHVVPRTAERIEVAADVGQAAVARLLRRHVIDRAERETGLGYAKLTLGRDPRQSQVGQLHVWPAVLLHEQQVGWFDVAVHHLILVQVLQGQGGLRQEQARLGRIQAPVPLEVLIQVDTIDVFESQVQHAIGLSELVNADDVFVPELGDVPRLTAEALDQDGFGNQLGRQYLVRHLAAEIGVHRPVDDGHAAAGQMGQDVVLADAAVAVRGCALDFF